MAWTIARTGARLLPLALVLSQGIALAQGPRFYSTQWTQWPNTAAWSPQPRRAEVPPVSDEPEPPIIRVQAITSEDVARSRGLDLTRLPGPERVFRIESEDDLRERIRQDARRAGRRAPPFPDEPTLDAAPLVPPAAPPVFVRVEPGYVCHERLMFEEINSERYGWDLGGIQALVLAADFYLKVLTAPGRRLLEPCRRIDTDLGLCLPGDPVPYVLRISSR